MIPGTLTLGQAGEKCKGELQRFPSRCRFLWLTYSATRVLKGAYKPAASSS